MRRADDLVAEEYALDERLVVMRALGADRPHHAVEPHEVDVLAAGVQDARLALGEFVVAADSDPGSIVHGSSLV